MHWWEHQHSQPNMYAAGGAEGLYLANEQRRLNALRAANRAEKKRRAALAKLGLGKDRGER